MNVSVIEFDQFSKYTMLSAKKYNAIYKYRRDGNTLHRLGVYSRVINNKFFGFKIDFEDYITW